MMESPASPPSASAVARNRFPGKVAIVTGGGSGIGKAIVERLAEEGATVAIFDINQDAGEKVAAALVARNLQAIYHKVDVSDKDQCSQAAAKVAESNSNQLHYLVNCAAYFVFKSLTAVKEDWDKSLSVNVVGYSNMVQACHPYISKMTGDKSIVNLASMSAYIAQPEYWTYNTTKGAIVILTKCMAMDLSKDGIRVNSVSPALTWTPQIQKIIGSSEIGKWESVWKKFNMLGRVCQASEVASAVCFLLSEDASFVTAYDLRVDGGYGSLGPEGLGDDSDNFRMEY